MYHRLAGKMFLYMRSCVLPVDLIHMADRLNHFVKVLDEEASFLIANDFGGRAACKRNNLTPWANCDQ